MYVHVPKVVALNLARSQLKTSFLGIELQSPLILGSGPLSFDGQAMIRAHQAGAGAVTTKTIRNEPAVNPYPHMAMAGRDTLINAEKWSDLSGEAWVEHEIPKAKAAGVVVIASIGHTLPEAEQWTRKVSAAGADILELVSYEESDMLPMIRHVKAVCTKPVLAKLSPNWPDPVASARAALAAGADGITAMDSVGPVLRIDIETALPITGGEQGFGWLTGAAIKPITLAYVARIARFCRKPIVGIGGVMSAEDAVEMLMAGASAVGICTAPIIKGIDFIGKLNQRIAAQLERLGYASVAAVSGAALPNLPPEEAKKRFGFKYDPAKCTECGACVRVCAYQARSMDGKRMFLDEEACRLCGLCALVCPTKALVMTKPDPAKDS
jgi:dihydroorotate dehydrogenase (fumarate)